MCPILSYQNIATLTPVYLKLKMGPVNALRLEWCYDTGNDKNITIIQLSMQLI